MPHTENNLAFVSIIIPCRNEAKYIGKCLDSIITADYPKDKIELLVIDGMSRDGTREVVKKYIKKYQFIKLINNYRKIVPIALNIGIKKAIGDIIIRIDAHSTYPSDYIEKLVLWLRESKADNVGGICVDPLKPEEIAKAIEYLIEHPDEARRMGENGRKAVLEKYNWENESKKFLKLYEEMIR